MKEITSKWYKSLQLCHKTKKKCHSYDKKNLSFDHVFHRKCTKHWQNKAERLWYSSYRHITLHIMEPWLKLVENVTDKFSFTFPMIWNWKRLKKEVSENRPRGGTRPEALSLHNECALQIYKPFSNPMPVFVRRHRLCLDWLLSALSLLLHLRCLWLYDQWHIWL